MNFNQYVQSMLSGSLNKPKRVSQASSRSEIPHEPAILSQGLTKDTATDNNQRATSEPATGEVVGLDPSTGEALVRQPGNRVVRVQAEGATAGNTVAVNPSPARTRSSLNVVKKSGTVTAKSSSSSGGWQPVEGNPSRSRLTSTSTRQVEGLDKLKDPCTPPDVKLQIVLAEQARGVGVTDRGVVGFTRSATGLVLANSAAQETQAYINQLYEEIRNKGGQSQTLPQQISLDSQGGTSTVGQQFSSTLAPLWKCVDGDCVQAQDGIFANREQCESFCGPRSFNCVNGTCVEVLGATGQFKTREDCIAQGCNTRYTCIDGSPVPSKTGEFATLEAAIAGGCYWGYDCDGEGGCSPAIGGSFKSLACCQLGCSDVSQGAVLTSINSSSGAQAFRGAFISVNGALNNRYLGGRPDENGAISDAYAVDLANAFTIQGDMRGFDDETGLPVPGSVPGRFSISRVAILSPEVKRLSLTISNAQLRFPFSGAPLETDEDVDSLIGNYRWAEYAIQPSKVLGPLQMPFLYQEAGGVPSQNPESYKAQLNYNQSPLTLLGNFDLYRDGDWPSSAVFNFQPNGAADPSQYSFTGIFEYLPTTNFTKYSSWSYDTSVNPPEIVVNYPTVVWNDPLSDVGPGTGNFWGNSENVALADTPVIAPGVFPSPLYKHGSGRSLFHAENWGVDFRAVSLSIGSVTVYPPIPSGVTIPPGFQPGQFYGGSFYAPNRYSFTVKVERMPEPNSVPTFYGESLAGLAPVLRGVAARKALLNSQAWTDYNAQASETEGYEG